MLSRKIPVLLAALALLTPLTATGQSGKGAAKTSIIKVSVGKGPVNAQTLITSYMQMAGSEDNARSLVNGLRSGSDITLTGGTCSQLCSAVTFKVTGRCEAFPPPLVPVPVACPGVIISPPTGNMGWANVQLALAFTAAQLTELEITQATPGELKAVLLGGMVEYGTSNPKMKRELPGILTLRSQGMGWPLIASQLEYQLLQ
jgi:hypothetical protein